MHKNALRFLSDTDQKLPQRRHEPVCVPDHELYGRESSRGNLCAQPCNNSCNALHFETALKTRKTDQMYGETLNER